MVNLYELFEVTPTITRVEIGARNSTGKLLHVFWYGKDCNREHLPKGYIQMWSKNMVSLSDAKINVHNDQKANGQPEMGWGYKDHAIPDELMAAEITRLNMRCRDGVEYIVWCDVVVPEITVDVLLMADKSIG